MIKRISSLKNTLNDKEAYLITSELHCFYLSGFRYTDGAFLITPKNAYLLCDFRYIEAARKNVTHCEVVCFNNLNETILSIINEDGIERLHFESTNVTVFIAEKYKNYFESNGIKTVFDNKLDIELFDLRIVKSEEEFKNIEKAQEITEKAFERVLKLIKPGMSEREIALEIEFEMRRLGASGVAFDLITICGKKTSMPHGEPDNSSLVSNGDFITMDIGAVYNGYHSDMTRTVALGYATEEMKNVYNIVLEAQLSALKVIKAGEKCSDCDRAARSVIESHGYGENFRHSTGHGVGLEIHESPALSPKCDTILKPGMVVTVEPGIYLQDKFGVRIEDMVYITETGYHNFTKQEKTLLILE